MARPARVPLLLLLSLAVALSVSHAGPLTGGLSRASTTDEDVQEIVDFAVSVYNAANNSPFLSRSVRVLSAQRQVVGGTNYYVNLEVARTTCAKSTATELQTTQATACPFATGQDAQQRERCSFVVYTRLWDDVVSVTSFSCREV